MSVFLTGTIIAVLLIIAVGFHFLGPVFAEFDSFPKVVGILLVIILGAGVYLSFTVPSIAQANPFARSVAPSENPPTIVTQDSPIGLQLQDK